MPTDCTEKAFEAAIEDHLLRKGVPGTGGSSGYTHTRPRVKGANSQPKTTIATPNR